MRKIIVGIAIATLMTPLHVLEGCGSEDDNGKPSGDAGLDGRGDGNVAPRSDCKVAGATCATSADCCTSNCNDTTHTCGSAFGQCNEPGGACTSNNQCCTFACTNGKCDSKHCIADSDACA